MKIGRKNAHFGATFVEVIKVNGRPCGTLYLHEGLKSKAEKQGNGAGVKWTAVSGRFGGYDGGYDGPYEEAVVTVRAYPAEGPNGSIIWNYWSLSPVS